MIFVNLATVNFRADARKAWRAGRKARGGEEGGGKMTEYRKRVGRT